MLLTEPFLVRDLVRRIEDRGWCKHCSPAEVFTLAGMLVPWIAAAALMFCTLGLFVGLFVAPTDAQLGEAYRIIFIHVPAAWMSVLTYLLLALCAGSGLVFNARLPAMMARALAPTGTMFAFLALWSGCLWAKPIWGTWWIWDLRLISELVLMSFYLGFIALQAAIDDAPLADKAGAVLALLGIVNIPINVLSVQWWTTLHQYTSIDLSSPLGMPPFMPTGALAMAAGFCLYGCAAALLRLRCIILERERDSDWVAARGRASP